MTPQVKHYVLSTLIIIIIRQYGQGKTVRPMKTDKEKTIGNQWKEQCAALCYRNFSVFSSVHFNMAMISAVKTQVYLALLYT